MEAVRKEKGLSRSWNENERCARMRIGCRYSTRRLQILAQQILAQQMPPRPLTPNPKPQTLAGAVQVLEGRYKGA